MKFLTFPRLKKWKSIFLVFLTSCQLWAHLDWFEVLNNNYCELYIQNNIIIMDQYQFKASHVWQCWSIGPLSLMRLTFVSFKTRRPKNLWSRRLDFTHCSGSMSELYLVCDITTLFQNGVFFFFGTNKHQNLMSSGHPTAYCWKQRDIQGRAVFHYNNS